MPKFNGHTGVSKETALKLRVVSKILPMILRMVERALGRWGGRLRLIDLNAGCGRYAYDGEELEGSPVIISTFAADLRVPHEVVLIEKREGVADELKQNLGGRAAQWVRVGDNRLVAPALIAAGDRRDKGLLVFDPNGPANEDEGSPLVLAASLSSSENARGLDYLIHANTSVLKLERCAATSESQGGKAGWTGKDVRPLAYRLQSIHKRFWMIRESYDGGWTLLYGTNFRFQNGWAREGLHWTDTPRGRELLVRHSFTEDELKVIEGAGIDPLSEAGQRWVERALRWCVVEAASGQRGLMNGEQPRSFLFGLRETQEDA